MARWAPAKTDILDELVAEVRHNYPNGRLVLAVDGVDGSGTDRFADDLASGFQRAGGVTVRASIDAFLGAEPQGDAAVQRYYADAYDYAAFQDRLVRPFRREKPFRLTPNGVDQEVEGDAVLVVDGPFLLRPELLGTWTSTVCLFVPTEEAFARAGGRADSVRRQAEELYLHRVQPRAKAIANIDNTDLEHPRRTFSDSC
jgi:uridine kinase